MRRNYCLYRLITKVWHSLSAWNTTGEGIHSPYLFEWVRMVMRDKNSYYAWEKIENERNKLLSDESEVEYVDYGTGVSVRGKVSRRLVCDIASTSLEPARYGKLLFRLVKWLGDKKRENGEEGLRIIELGASLGVTTAYLAAADVKNEVVTYEGCPAVAKRAEKVWKQLGVHNVNCVVGNIDDTLFNMCISARACEVDVVFMDANHTKEATIRYFERILPLLHEKSVVVVDDIYYSPEMTAAWRWICAHDKVTSTIDMHKMGLVFFDPCFWHRNYKIRLV